MGKRSAAALAAVRRGEAELGGGEEA
jgi:hypothetical protein